MKDRGTDSDERNREENEPKIWRDRKQDQTDERRSHSQSERERLRMSVGKRANERLQQRRGELVRERDQADVAVIEPQLRLQDRINRGDQRLKRVVDEMSEAEREKNAEGRRNLDRLGLIDAGRRTVRWCFTRRAHRDTLNALVSGVA